MASDLVAACHHDFVAESENPGVGKRLAVVGGVDRCALRYAKIANRTLAEEYFAVTDKVEAL